VDDIQNRQGGSSRERAPSCAFEGAAALPPLVYWLSQLQRNTIALQRAGTSPGAALQDARVLAAALHQGHQLTSQLEWQGGRVCWETYAREMRRHRGAAGEMAFQGLGNLSEGQMGHEAQAEVWDGRKRWKPT
jgi:hypothetical protein